MLVAEPVADDEETRRCSERRAKLPIVRGVWLGEELSGFCRPVINGPTVVSRLAWLLAVERPDQLRTASAGVGCQ